ncbi:hypothetical protein P153DRAFT_350410 [Dothidotthia symphoricarpi CBS 119687]|uniref:Zn(2)-C6 fungal-type domain-containing protein n=1 Tax=Dothidotthia symphoricarpi CBS 119687 TaxID=1392245 RepID=A0A6A5ZZT5_9PLEO|nr:uncharacterized protein P153DRAFT_350410 [Dothidotthia symphoricarpi CBS 119687]KAF2124414.1 hypothetical protein P153DRAFT_350410 [Dothidotthia symphoricarpi CBS 119687]
MTQTGKCDTCRQRKVKCDEERPKCGACRKKDRPCAYSYGKASALVVQDPNQLTKHGRSKVEPVVYALNSPEDDISSTGFVSSSLLLTTEREADHGKGVFRTLASSSKPRSRKAAGIQKKKLEAYLQHLHSQSALTWHRPSSFESTLIARYIDMLGSGPVSQQPLSILGTWILSIPSRIGSNRMLDLAVEFLMSSYAAYWDNSHSKRAVARTIKAKALKELQLVVCDASEGATYEVLLATKMHYAAEALLGVGSMYHAIHAFGLAELLKSGAVANVDDDHFWNLIDNTYIDDVNEAMLAGRKSVYDNEFYLSTTYPPPRSSSLMSLTPVQRASMAIMHVFIQCPRLVYLVRHAVSHPDDSSALASAVSLAESLWQVDLPDQVSDFLKSSITTTHKPSFPETADILPDSLHFDSVQSMILCTRYWMLQNVLCGLTDTLHRYFPVEVALAMLPDPEARRRIDVDAGLQLAKSLTWAESVSRELPLVPLRLHTPLQISIGPWYRTIRHAGSLHSSGMSLSPELESELSRAYRMKALLINECNRIHKQWDVSTVDEDPLIEALDSMAGEKIPDWLPIRVRFETEDGEMVMKLEYEKTSSSHQERVTLGGETPITTPYSPPTFEQHGSECCGSSTYDLPYHTAPSDESYKPLIATASSAQTNPCMSPGWSASPRPADFLHSTGRNLCSTSGWWPDTSRTSTVLLDSTHKASAFSKRDPSPYIAPSW